MNKKARMRFGLSSEKDIVIDGEAGEWLTSQIDRIGRVGCWEMRSAKCEPKGNALLDAADLRCEV